MTRKNNGIARPPVETEGRAGVGAHQEPTAGRAESKPDSDALAVALAAPRPLPSSPEEDHDDLERKLRAGHWPAPSDADLDAMGDPRRDRPHQARSRSKTNRLLRILDNLENVNPNRKCHH